MAARVTSLRFRTTLLVIMAIVAVLGTATMAIDVRVDDEVAQRADTNLLERAQALADIYTTQSQASSQVFPSYWIPSFLADDGTVYFHIDCGNQHVVSSSQAAALAWPSLPSGQAMAFVDMADRQGTALRAIALRFSTNANVPRGAGDGNADVAGALGAPECVLGLAVDRSEASDFQQSLDRIEFGAVVLGLLVVAVLTPLLVTRSLRPLSGLAEAMEMIGPDTPSVRLADTRIRELAPLIARFNEVLSRMEEGLLRERQFASSAAHELRTPLAELRTAIEVELRYPSGRDVRELLADIGQIGQNMERMVAALLLLTRIEAGIEQRSWQRVDVSALTQALIERHRPRLEERSLTLAAHIDAHATWLADPALLDVVLGNLLGNAFAYAPAGSAIALRCTAAEWSVSNPAPDLTAEDVARMQQRFWRKGKEAGVHTGLGLSLAASAARAQSLRMELLLCDGNLQARVLARPP